jgi:queuosine precursor transporter
MACRPYPARRRDFILSDELSLWRYILTEVYGYARSRRVVWAGFSALIFASFMSWVVLSLPPAPSWHQQAAYETVFGTTPRIALASMVAYFAGEF